MQSVAVGWQVFEITKRPLDLGYVGLAQFWPTLVLFLVAGHAADRFNRRNIVTLCYAGLGLASTILFLLTINGSRSVHAIYAALTLVGIVRSFNGAAGQSMVPQLVPEQHSLTLSRGRKRCLTLPPLLGLRWVASYMRSSAGQRPCMPVPWWRQRFLS
jgi:MFS family permease